MEFADVKVELVNIPDCLPTIKITFDDQLMWYCKASEAYKEVLDYVLFRNSEIHHLIINGIYHKNNVKNVWGTLCCSVNRQKQTGSISIQGTQYVECTRQDIDLLVTRIQNLLMQTLTSKVWD